MPEGSSASSTEDEIKKTKDLFDKAEGLMKSLEHVDGLYIPSTNQLRYAGRHLINFLSVGSGLEELQKARRHCQRAVYDACDAHIQYYINEIEIFKNDFKYVEICDVYPEYLKMISAKDEAVRLLEDGLSEGENRDALYARSIAMKDALQEYCQNLLHVREELNKRVNGIRRSAMAQWVLGAIALVGTLAAVYSAWVAFNLLPAPVQNTTISSEQLQE